METLGKFETSFSCISPPLLMYLFNFGEFNWYWRVKGWLGDYILVLKAFPAKELFIFMLFNLFASLIDYYFALVSIFVYELKS